MSPRTYLPRILLRFILPRHKAERGDDQRRVGNWSYAVHSCGSIGLPFGCPARLLLVWLTTEALRRESRELSLGPTFDAYVSKVGLEEGVGSCIRGHMKRLFSATFSVLLADSNDWIVHGFRVAERVELRGQSVASKRRFDPTSRVVLSRDFFESIIDRPVPVDLEVLSQLRSPFAFDLYAWLVYWTRSIAEPTTVGWHAVEEALAGRVGKAGFQDRFLRHLEAAREIYTVPAQACRRGLKLRPCARTGATRVASRHPEWQRGARKRAGDAPPS